MPAVEFALDAITLSRVQVHLNAHQGPVSVMLNHSALGSLATLEEQTTGKDFWLPDNSILRVRIIDGHPQAWRNGLPLLRTSGAEAQYATERQVRDNLGGCATLLLCLNILVNGTLSVWSFFESINGVNASKLFLPLLLSGVVSLVALLGLFTLLAWKRWGSYLTACCALANTLLAIISGTSDYRTFIPMIGLILLYYYLYSSGIWRKMS